MLKFWLLGVCPLMLSVGCGRRAVQVRGVEAIEVLASEIDDAGPIEVAAEDWPWWRGTNRNGVAAEQSVPVTWSARENIVWSAPVPGRGHSSPIVWQDRVFISSADEDAKTQLVLCYDRARGKQLWETICFSGGLPKMHRKNSHASATPACDGTHVFTAFISQSALYVTALDHNGKIAWQTEVGPFRSEHGYGSSPLIYESLVIVNGDSLGSAYQAALHRDTGEIVWRTPRTPDSRHGSYASPVVAELAGEDQLIQCGLNRVTSYRPSTGEELWHVDGPTTVMANTVAFQDPYVIASGGYPDKEVFCISADGTGDVTESHLVWRRSRNVAYVPSPVIAGDRVILVADNGVVACYALEGGEMLWQQRLKGGFSASPTRVGETFYVPNESGTTFVFNAGESFELLAENSLDDSGGFASPTICGGQVFLRTNAKLFCIGSGGSAAGRKLSRFE